MLEFHHEHPATSNDLNNIETLAKSAVANKGKMNENHPKKFPDNINRFEVNRSNHKSRYPDKDLSLSPFK